jgi:predicted transcriptional regulator
LLYDLSKWGEDVGVASKATFSRVKTNLEEQGLLDTEKVPIDVGRPRLRLLLGDERLREADPEELPSVVREMLAATPA